MSLFRRKRRPRSKENPKRVLIKQIAVGLMLFVLVFILGAGIWYGTRLSIFTIQAVSATGGVTVDNEYVESVANEKLAGNYLGLVPRRFTWTYPKEEIEQAILEITKVKDISLKLGPYEDLQIKFTEYKPTALWCEVGASKGCVYMDEFGYAFAKAPALDGSALIRFSEQGRVPEEGGQAFDADFIDESFKLIASAYDSLGFNITEINKTASDEAIYKVSGGGEIKVSLHQPIEETLDNFGTILTSQEYQHLAPGNFEYIDLRYGNKVFIMEEPAPASTESEDVEPEEGVEPEIKTEDQ